jgi:hypothetical protein
MLEYWLNWIGFAGCIILAALCLYFVLKGEHKK